jgi:nucleotide-binding universal stress UspA family protein
MYNKILAPLDGSKFSECALEHVQAIAKSSPASEITLLSVVKEAERPFFGEYLSQSDAERVGKEFAESNQRLQESAEKYLADQANALIQKGITVKRVSIQAKASEGVAEKILDYVEKNKVDLIIMSTHGRSGISRWAMGSVADKVVHSARAPVLSITPAGCRA